MDHRTSKKFLVVLMLLGSIFTILSCILIFVNPIQIAVNMKLRLANGTLIHELLKHEMKGAKLTFFLFNITNADAFKAGVEDVLKVNEVGPFVYQEYRTNDDLEINVEPGLMRYTPKLRTELVLEESVGRPEDFSVVLPNIALLSAVQLLSKYPIFIRQLFKVFTSGLSRDPMPRINAYKYLWGNTDPLISAVNTVLPGLIYYNSTGILTRFYDLDAKYRLTVGTTDLDKFQVKTVKKFSVNKDLKSGNMLENTEVFNNTYEGAAFPPRITPDFPIELYRHRICKTFRMVYSGRTQTSFGSEAFVYNIDNSTFQEFKACDSKGWCPNGILDLSPCYNGFPFVLSKGHFYDTEPKLFEKIKGLKPSRSLHESTLIMDPNVGVTLSVSMPMQLSMALGDMSLFKETRRMSDMFLPITYCLTSYPRMPEEGQSILRLLYTYGPYILISAQVVSALFGISLIAYAVRCWRKADRNKALSNKCSLKSQSPLIKKQ